MKKILFIAIVLINISCSDEQIVPTVSEDLECQDSRPMTTLLSQFLIEEHDFVLLSEWADFERHWFEFKLSKNARLCEIGYQSRNQNIVFNIEVANEQNEVLYQTSSTFPEDTIGYISVQDWILEADIEYNVSRTPISYIDTSDINGIFLRNSYDPATIQLPYQFDYFSITDSPLKIFIPFIDLKLIEI